MDSVLAAEFRDNHGIPVSMTAPRGAPIPEHPVIVLAKNLARKGLITYEPAIGFGWPHRRGDCLRARPAPRRRLERLCKIAYLNPGRYVAHGDSSATLPARQARGSRPSGRHERAFQRGVVCVAGRRVGAV